MRPHTCWRLGAHIGVSSVPGKLSQLSCRCILKTFDFLSHHETGDAEITSGPTLYIKMAMIFRAFCPTVPTMHSFRSLQTP